MNIYLAAILGLLMLTNYAVEAAVFSGRPLSFAQETQPQGEAPPPSSSTEPAPNAQRPAQETPPGPEAAPEKAGPEKGNKEQPPAAPAPAATPAPATSTKTPKSTAKATRKRRRRRPVVAKTSEEPEKKVVRNGGTTDPPGQLAPGVTNEQASKQRQSTSQLLATTDTNLKQLASRQLNETQQDSVSQIRKYMEQAKAAEDAGDVQRAQNLASKALMLSDDLVKH
jgi:hypothetical protein